MKRFLLLLTIAFGFTAVSGQTTFQKTYAASGGTGMFARQTTDGGYIMTGFRGFYEIYLVKADQNGVLQWSKTFIDTVTGSQLGRSVIQTKDGFVICGQANSSLSIGAFLLKTDSSGAMKWSKFYDGGSIQLTETHDTGFAIIGGGMYLAKTDSIGNLKWAKTIGGGSNHESGTAIIQNSDGSFTIAGSTSSFGAGNSDFYIIKTSSNGTLLWTKTFGESGYDIIQDMRSTFDGGYILTGWTDIWNNQNLPCLIKTDSSGNIQWSKVYGPEYNLGLSVCQTPDSGFAVVCTTATVFKTDKYGTLLWAKNYSGKTGGYTSGRSIQTTNDGGLMIFGSKNGFCLIKTDSNGNLNCNDSNVTLIDTSIAFSMGAGGSVINVGTESNASPSISNVTTIEKTICAVVGIPDEKNEMDPLLIFPNPFSAQTVLHTEKFLNKSTLTICNLQGQTVRQITNISGRLVTISRDNLPSGLYFLRLTEEDKTYRGKLIITDN